MGTDLLLCECFVGEVDTTLLYGAHVEGDTVVLRCGDHALEECEPYVSEEA